MRKVWIDTDAGTDDAMALIMAMREPTIDIIGISTIGGNVPLDCVVQNVLYIRDLCENDSPVYIGARQPLNRILGTADFIHGKDGLGDVGLPLHGRIPAKKPAVDALITAIKADPHTIELIMLGPLTNLALALQKAPEIAKLIGHCHIMGGLLELPGNVTPLAEFNIWADPEAADIIFTSGMPMTVIGWDTTMESGWLSVEEWQELLTFDTKLSTFAHDIQGVRMRWQKDNDQDQKLTWADPTAMATIVSPSCIKEATYTSMHIQSDAEDPTLRGFIECLPMEEGQGIKFIKSIDRSQFRELIHHYLTVDL